jgi:hypothetical protein
LGYSLLVFVYNKHDDQKLRAARLDVKHTIFVEQDRTADYQTTSGLLRLLENKANRDDLLAFFQERMLPLDEIGAGNRDAFAAAFARQGKNLLTSLR